MGILDDSDSDDDVSTCSEGSVEETPMPAAAKKSASGRSPIRKSGSSASDGSVEDRLDALMALKAEMGMDQDPEFVRKEKKKEELRRKEDEEAKQLEGLSLEERIKTQQSSVGDMMSLIRKKRELSKRNLISDMDGDDTAAGAEKKKPEKVAPKKAGKKEDDEMEEFRRLKMKKANSKKKLLQKKANSKKKPQEAPKQTAVAAS